ncbi:DUF6090 family protein [Hanstruepera ponticola]|uniref:DUF6090 family protein n=1 Tax=Hanstruepera ponticola TaxID=2042995 RepID=UPI0013C3EF3D|nr:DUF6090 family protein [Hanstruepera ponticola]
MIKFFRKIRYNLMEQNKTGKYFKYAIGEIILVVIGILIALQINNWNEQRNKNSLEKQYIIRLIEDLKEEEALVKAVINYSNQILHHAKNAISLFEDPQKEITNPSRSLVDMYQASQLQDPNSIKSTYLELIASGQINLIKKDSLKTALIRHYEVEWSKNKLFEMNNDYRKNLRSKMPNFIQEKIREKCDDIYYKVRNSIEARLPENCEVDISDDEAVIAIELLRNDTSLKKDLRFLIGNEGAKKFLLETHLTQLQRLIQDLETTVNHD